MIKEVYSRTWYIEKRRRLRECKESSSKAWRKIEYRSKKIRKYRNSRREKFQEKRNTKEVYSKDVV